MERRVFSAAGRAMPRTMESPEVAGSAMRRTSEQFEGLCPTLFLAQGQSQELLGIGSLAAGMATLRKERV
eukprot:scaffold281938_cov15-Tisochrysis_lutea.AAC.2